MVAMGQTQTNATGDSVLIVEDESVSRMAMALLLRANGYHAVTASSAEEALQLIDDGPLPNVALVDLDLPGMNGADLIASLQAKGQLSAVLITAAARERIDALSLQGVPFFRKPIDFRELLHTLADRDF